MMPDLRFHQLLATSSSIYLQVSSAAISRWL